VLVTGTDTGFGHLTAIRLNKLGFQVFAGCLKSDSDGAGLLRSNVIYPEKLHVLQMDITKDDDVTQCRDEVIAELAKSNRKLHAIVNNAGVADIGLIEWPKDVEDIKHILDVNTLGMVRVTRAFLPLIRESKGRVVNLTSLMSKIALPFMCGYDMSKSAAAAFTECLAGEMIKFNVKVIDIEPWYYSTNICNFERYAQNALSKWHELSEEQRVAYDSNTLHCVTEACRFILTNPLNVSPNLYEVIDAIESGVTSCDPEPVYRVMRLDLKLIFWFYIDFLPRDLSYFLRKLSLQAFELYVLTKSKLD
jgi:NAD(P)-dependent dehydrogenase (short-subunit alcohol dehydrogenase family)